MKREITRADIIAIDDYAKNRREHKRRVAEIKRHRRVEVGPFATFYFENFDTMWHQVHEMLHIERGGEAQITDELDAYNPLIPQGAELVATVMFEIDDPLRRGNVLGQLGGVENNMYLSVGGERVMGEPDPTRENTSPEGKASAVQFVRFRFSPAQIAKFRDPATQVLVGIDHPRYGHIAVMPDAVRAALAGDFAA
ncbi:MAG TPA: DUF3501 family protein [Stellaceae bacterium]|jgi:hypothetical protein|nr:DUF3501 family protein [Stellaceae bacterium]